VRPRPRPQCRAASEVDAQTGDDCKRSAALARKGFFVEATALMDAARALMNAVTPEAAVIDLEAVRRRRAP
jgi:hypothetical protein